MFMMDDMLLNRQKTLAQPNFQLSKSLSQFLFVNGKDQIPVAAAFRCPGYAAVRR